MKSFRKGGIHPSEYKLSASSPVERLPLPDTVVLPLAQHIGAPATTVVAKGDRVVAGQLVAEAAGFVSARVHASVSGTVIGTDPVPNGQGLLQPAVTIRREGDEWLGTIDRTERLVDDSECGLAPHEILDRIRAAGIVGMGGAAFPTHVKLSVPDDRRVDCLVVNGAECEPYLTSDHRTMLERGEELLVGVALLMRAVGVERALIGIENNKPDAVAHLAHLAARRRGIEVVPLRTKYPQGGEKQLIEALTGREVPPPPALPIDVGVVVCNVSTAVAVYDAVQKRRPLVERVVTVSGSGVREPHNFLVRLGTPVSVLVEAAGGLVDGPCKILNGGPMMGRAVVCPDAPVTKGCSGITVLAGAAALRRPESSCIRCARCVGACPMGLEPYLLSRGAQRRDWELLDERGVASCIECGSCQAGCPAYLPLLDWIRAGKQAVAAMRRVRATR